MAAFARHRVREDPVVRKRQIVDEAMRVIGQQGFNGFTIQVGCSIILGPKTRC
jgi:DNA-binding transcriptional regulator YbjK